MEVPTGQSLDAECSRPFPASSRYWRNRHWSMDAPVPNMPDLGASLRCTTGEGGEGLDAA